MYRTGRNRGIIPVSVLATADPVLRDSALFGLLMDAPGIVAVRHDIYADHLRRVVLDATGVIDDVLVPLQHACLSCAVREDAVLDGIRVGVGVQAGAEHLRVVH